METINTDRAASTRENLQEPKYKHTTEATMCHFQTLHVRNEVSAVFRLGPTVRVASYGGKLYSQNIQINQQRRAFIVLFANADMKEVKG